MTDFVRDRIVPASAPAPFLRLLWTAAGTILLAIGVAGIVLPLLPGTIFLFAASACFVRGSARLDAWLRGHRVLGRHVRIMAGEEAMPRRSKVVALSAMWVAVLASLNASSHVPVQLTMTLLAVTGTWFITVRR